MDGNIREISLKECRSLVQQFYDSKEVLASACHCSECVIIDQVFD
jgi:hypothetical protein